MATHKAKPVCRVQDSNGNVERVFSAKAYSTAFAVLAGAFFVAALSISVVCILVCGGCDGRKHSRADRSVTK